MKRLIAWALSLLLSFAPASAQMMATGIGGGGFGAAAGGGCTEATNYLNRVAAIPFSLSSPYPAAYTTMICGLVTDGTWSLFNGFWITATQNVAVAPLNLVSSSFTLSTVGTALTFNAGQGYTTTATGVIDMNFIPNTNGGGVYQQNAASIGVCISTNDTGAANKFDIGTNDGTENITGAANVQNANGYNINDTTFNQDITATTSRGIWAWTRIADGSSAGSRISYGPTAGNSGPLNTDSTTAPSVGLPTTTVYVGARNFLGSLSFPTSRTYPAFWIGNKITGAQFASISNRIKQFMTDISLTECQ